MELPFSKYSGCGNDFVLINNLAGQFPSQNCNLIRQLCHRQAGIGADGVILLEKGQKEDFRMRIYNRDGSEAEMCGNGLRCLMKFIQDQGIGSCKCVIETMHRQLQVEMQGDQVVMQMGAPQDICWGLNISVDNAAYTVDFLDTGVPHTLLFVENLDEICVDELGPKFRYHMQFAPRGTNVNFVKLSGPNSIRLRTYERGVEQETLACGTGAAAAAIGAGFRGYMQPPIRVEFKSGDSVEVDYQLQDGRILDVVQAGPAHKIFHGFITLP